jgi:16S rRNA processing protein RimM
LINSDDIAIAKIGKSVGLQGDLKLHLLTDFPEQFKPQTTFKSEKQELTIERYNAKRGTVKFVGYDNPEDARVHTNKHLYSTAEQSREALNLGKDEYFYFDIIGCDVVEEGETLGSIKEITRFGVSDYLVVVKEEKEYLVPYVDRYIIDVDLEAKAVNTQDVKLLLE